MRYLDRWLVPYVLQTGRRLRRSLGPIHVLICIADHFEPKIAHATPAVARSRVEKWVCEYPKKFGDCRDSDGRTPRHSFFYPIEDYEYELVEGLAGLCRAGYGEVEFHLHHDQDTAGQPQADVAGGRRLLPIPSWPARPRAEDRSSGFRFHPRELGTR